MRTKCGRLAKDWRAEAAVCALALLLAAGTLAWEQALHSLLLTGEPAPRGSHLLRDGLLLVPLALVAAGWGMSSGRLHRLGIARAAAGVAAAFAALLGPAAAAHDALDAADGAAVAHAESPGGVLSMGAGESEGVASTLAHGATDAMLSLPAAFLVSLAALAVIRRRRREPSSPHRRVVLLASTLMLAAAATLVPASSAESPPYAKFSQPLAIPRVLTGQDVDIAMAETQEQILPGAPTTMWTYDGSFPGPVIRRPTGVPTRVRVTNNLPASAGSMSLHHHGSHTTEESDGHPSRHLIAPGSSKTYTYPAVETGGPERAAPQWYHDHRDMVTGRNVWMGLIGAFIYDDPVEQRLNLPKGEFDVPLLVTDRSFDAGNQIPYVFNPSGTMGDVILVNGVPQPFQEVGDRRYRFRLYNVSNKRDYTFRLSDGQPMTQIGTDSGLLPAPVSRTAIRLGPAERADVIIDFAGRLGQSIVLENGDAATGPGERDGEVMEFRVTRDVTDDSSPAPPSLRPQLATGTPVTTRTWNFDRSIGAWTINGLEFDPERVDARPRLGTTERWVFRNPSAQAHIVHTHLSDQKLVSRNGRAPTPQERLKESWYLAPDEEVVVDVKFTDHVGKFVMHCHVLEHEDDAMMTQFETAPAPVPPRYAVPPGTNTSRPAAPVSLRIKILSSKRLRRVLRRGLRFESGVPSNGSALRATLTARGRILGTLRRRNLSRGRARSTLKLSRRGKARLRSLVGRRGAVRAVLKVRAGGKTATARFTIGR